MRIEYSLHGPLHRLQQPLFGGLSSLTLDNRTATDRIVLFWFVAAPRQPLFTHDKCRTMPDHGQHRDGSTIAFCAWQWSFAVEMGTSKASTSSHCSTMHDENTERYPSQPFSSIAARS
jgi:hypothetical protein